MDKFENFVNDITIEIALREAVAAGDFTEAVMNIIRKVYKIGFTDGAKYMINNKDKWNEPEKMEN